MRYQKSLAKLCDTFNFNSFPLWCYTVSPAFMPGMPSGRIKWEIYAPESEIVTAINEVEWDKYLKGKDVPWECVFSIKRPILPAENTTVILHFPLSKACGLKRIGMWVCQLWEDEALTWPVMSKRRQSDALQKYRDIFHDETAQDCERDIARERLEYLRVEHGIE